MDKRKMSWFSWGTSTSSTHKSKSSMSTFIQSPRTGRQDSLADDHIELRKQPSISITEADSVRRPSENDSRSWYADQASISHSHREMDKDLV